MATNKLTEVAGLVAQAVMGAKVKDKDGNDKIVKPDGDANYLDLRDIVAGSSGTGGGDNPDHPSAGADYFAGSLADGEITERKLLWQGSTDPTKVNNLTLLEDVGAKFNMAGDGAMYLVHIQKTVMTAGVKGATSVLQLNYDPNNAAKEGYFTTTSVYPIYISTGNLSTHQELVVPINGIGENLSGKNVKAPELHVTFKDDKTMDISTVTGYNNDGADSGATGANYDIVVEVVSTFSTQKAVAQLPASINLFTGASSGDVALAGSTDFYENVMDGIEIKIDDFLYSKSSDTFRISLDQFGLGDTIRIPKSYLVKNNVYQIPFIHKPLTDASKNYQYHFVDADGTPTKLNVQRQGSYNYSDYSGDPMYYTSETSTNIIINSNALEVNIERGVSTNTSGMWSKGAAPYVAKVLRVTPYKD